MSSTIRADGPVPTKLDRFRALLRVPGPVDPIMAATVVTLVAFGVVMVYSASAVEATVQYKDPQYFLKRQVSFGIAASNRM